MSFKENWIFFFFLMPFLAIAEILNRIIFDTDEYYEVTYVVFGVISLIIFFVFKAKMSKDDDEDETQTEK